MQACGNDFVVVDAYKTNTTDIEHAAASICARHFGIGADGLILICPSKTADARMRIINADGSEVNMCGNGIRCAAKFIHDTGICVKDELSIETGAGVLKLHLDMNSSGKVEAVTVDMGLPSTQPSDYPLLSDNNRVTVQYEGQELHFFCVNTGVPHAVTFDIFPDGEEFARIGSWMEHHPLFPERTNVCFGRADDSKHVAAHIWERGCGATLACGTGSCAVLYAGHALGYNDSEADINLPGGVLHDSIQENGHIFMTGPAVEVFNGELSF